MRDRFLTEVRVENGFIANQQLLDGLLTTYDESWGSLIENFYNESELHSCPMATSEFKRSQLYMFYCWFLWGPSIPVGTCGRRQDRVALQYGFWR